MAGRLLNVLFLCTGNSARSILQGGDDERRKAFKEAFLRLSSRINLMLALPIDKLQRQALASELGRIGKIKE